MKNIVKAITYQANSSKSESTNAIIQGLIRIAKGFRNIKNMIALIYLKCSNIVIPLCNRCVPSEKYLSEKRNRDRERRELRKEQRLKAQIA